MAGFYFARDRIIPPLPWPTFAPLISANSSKVTKNAFFMPFYKHFLFTRLASSVHVVYVVVEGAKLQGVAFMNETFHGHESAFDDNYLSDQVHLPIVVDLDGTLNLSDTLHESASIALFRQPRTLFRGLLALRQGRHSLKARLADSVDLSGTLLPLREDLIEWLREKHAEGHEIHLCSAADQRVVDEVARRVGFFSSAVGSNGKNLRGQAKADFLSEEFPEGFIYAGNDGSDLAVWNKSSGIILAGVSDSLKQKAKSLEKPVLAEFSNPHLTKKSFAKAIRVHHWSKNVLVFVPLILAHQWGDFELVLATIAGFIALLAVTSATYLLNDISDLRSDRQHWSKKNRALASGQLSIQAGYMLAAIFFVFGFGISALLSLHLFLALLAYLALTGAYSLGLKRIPLLDMLVIGILFTIRLVIGIVLLTSPSPAWLLTFSVFFFFSLAAAKRHTEILRAADAGSDSLRSRGYQPEDEPLTLVLGGGAAIASLVVLVIFILQEMLPGSSYGYPAFLGGIPILLSIWLGRIWLLAHRGQMMDDPVSFAIRDKASIWLAVCIALLFLVAL